jgi:hypothetical protein
MRRIIAAFVVVAALSEGGCGRSSIPPDNGGKGGSAENRTDKGQPSSAVDDRNALDAKDVRALSAEEGKRVRVRGKVYSTHQAKSGKVFTLNFGPNWKTCFKVAIFQNSFGKWENGVKDIKTMYEGKTVVVEGEVKMYQGIPEVIVNVPSQVQVLPGAGR